MIVKPLSLGCNMLQPLIEQLITSANPTARGSGQCNWILLWTFVNTQQALRIKMYSTYYMIQTVYT